jgi:hypothetical protein
MLPLSPAAPITEEDCQTPIGDDETAAMLDYQHDQFKNTDWKRSYAVTEDWAYVAYINDSMSAVARIDVIRLCGAENALEGYASPETIDVIMAEYEDVVLEDSCRQGNTLLFEHSATSQGYAYRSKLWFEPMEDPNRVLKVTIVFPADDVGNMDSFSKAFFPDFSSCGGTN